MLAEIVSRENDWSDLLFLIALILGVVAAFLAWPERKLTSTLGWAAVAAVAFGLMLL